MAILVHARKVEPFFSLLYISLSILTFFFYWRDKKKAIKDEWRTAENTLHFFSLIGGWPGALLAQRILRHKSRKRSFQIIFLITAFVNITMVSSYTISGSNYLKSDRFTQFYHQLFKQSPSPSLRKSNNYPKNAVYSWINKDRKKVYSNVGFPPDEPYRDGKIEWH